MRQSKHKGLKSIELIIDDTKAESLHVCGRLCGRSAVCTLSFCSAFKLGSFETPPDSACSQPLLTLGLRT